LPYMVNDFGARGATDWMAHYRGGIGHLLHFQGSDNLIASRAIDHYYGYKGRAKSIYATEHSIALSFGISQEEEVEYVLHQLNTCPLDMPCAIVMDTKDLINFMTNVIGDPRVVAKIKERTASTVGRPDSGVPLESIERCLDIATSIFGFTINAKGYKLLNDNFRLIQGDGMNEESIISLYEAVVHNRWSTDNLFVGSGGGLLQVDLNRDTMRWAIKPSYGIINGVEKNFQKLVASQPDKASKPGRLILHPTGKDHYMTYSSATTSPTMFGSYNDILKPLYHDGEFTPPLFQDMIARAEASYSLLGALNLNLITIST
jgi:nicotinamide phosphoribosyltransferase